MGKTLACYVQPLGCSNVTILKAWLFQNKNLNPEEPGDQHLVFFPRFRSLQEMYKGK